MSKNNKSRVYRQGDVLLIPVNKIPEGLKRTKRVTLALGEVTGHHHSIFDGGAIGFADDENALAEYLQVDADSVELTHQEHDSITIDKGLYKNVHQFEYTPQAIQRVAD